jgi:hypothetical protein
MMPRWASSWCSRGRIVRHRRKQVVLDVIVHVVRKQHEPRKRADDIGARCGERRRKIGYRPMLADCAQTQNGLQDAQQGNDPQHYILAERHRPAKYQQHNWNRNVESRHGQPITARGGAQCG